MSLWYDFGSTACVPLAKARNFYRIDAVLMCRTALRLLFDRGIKDVDCRPIEYVIIDVSEQ